ncbi:MAG: 5-formyltetrahydrofolate cyclo-ligase [Actinomycetes bacterium]
MDIKQKLRDRYRSERSLKDHVESWIHILNSTEFISAKTIATYHSYNEEPQTQDLNAQLIARGFNVALPRVLKDHDLEWVLWDGSNESLRKSGKIMEPIGVAISPGELDIVIVPSLHVNQDGYRLGQGGGSYDRALKGLNAWTIGLIYAGELTPEPMPVEPHDVKLSAVATPDLIIRFPKAN